MRASPGNQKGAVMPAHWSYPVRKAFHIVALCVAVLAAFSFVVLPIAFGLAGYRDTPPTTESNLIPATVCGLIASLFVVVFHVKKETAVVPFKNRKEFLAACRIVLRDLGYEVAEKPDESLVSRPSFRALLFGGRIHIQPLENEGRITGPKFFVEILRNRLRLHSHIAGVEQNKSLSGIRKMDRLLKRVHISLRLTPEQWQGAGDAVIQKLVGDGTEIFCEVHLMAQSEKGIRESLVEGSIRKWLQQEHIQAEIHKDHTRWDAPMARAYPTEEEAMAADDVKCAN